MQPLQRDPEMKPKAFREYKEPDAKDMEELHSRLKELVADAARILQKKKGRHGYYITPYVSDEIEMAFNLLCEVEELFAKDNELRKEQFYHDELDI